MDEKWPFLWELVEGSSQRGSLLSIDAVFAQKAESEEEAALLATLLAFYRLGHLCLKVDNERTLPDLRLLTPYPGELEKRIRKGAASPFVIREENRFYLSRLWHLEQQFVSETVRLLKTVQDPLSCSLLPPSCSLTDEQKQAVQKALQFPLSLIAGGPGTGKSFTASAIANGFKSQGRSAILLAAPTGKAAAHLEKKLPGFEATTLHKLLGVSSAKDFQELPPWIYMDLLIVDECSMIDPALFARLMRSVQGDTHLVLIGDPHQLPAVEGGSFFADLLAGGTVPFTELTTSLRFEEKGLFSLAEAILAGDLPKIPLDPFPSEQKIWESVSSHFPKPTRQIEEDLSLFHRFALLTPLRRGPFGVESLNRVLLSRFKSLGFYGQYLQIPILISKSDQRLGLCNGQMGLLIHCIGKSEKDYALFEGGQRLPRSQLPSFEIAYAISVHKSQGSEYEEALLLIPEGSESFGRELLYTGATRARKKLTIAGEKERIEKLLSQVSGKVSGVQEKLMASELC